MRYALGIVYLQVISKENLDWSKLVEVFRAKMVWQQGVERRLAYFSGCITEQNWNVTAEFDENLPAGTTGRTAIFRADRDGQYLLVAVGYGLEHGRSLRAV